MELTGYAAAVVIGITLGLMGGGGSILTLPVLVYLFKIPTPLATTDSLFLVGVTAAVGAGLMARQRLVVGKVAVSFALPAFLTVWLTRRYILHSLPEHFGSLHRDTLLLLLFAGLMLITAVSMFRPRTEVAHDAADTTVDLPRLISTALLVGLITGLVGAGGGFLIVPALALAAKLPMKCAVGTSLTIIAANSLVGFVSDPHVWTETNWSFLMLLTCLAILGMGIGAKLAHHIPGAKLRPAFGGFLLVMGAFMVVRELLFSAH